MKDNKRQLMTIAVVGLVSIAMYYFFMAGDGCAGDAAETRAPEAQQQQPAKTKTKAGARPERPRQSVAERERQRVRQQKLARIRTDDFEVTLTNLNTGVRHARLLSKRYERDGRPIDVVTTDKEPYLAFRIAVNGIEIPDDAVWRMQQVSDREVRFALDADGFRIERKIEAGRGPFQLWSTVSITNLSRGERPVRLRHLTNHYVRRDDESGGFFAARSPATSLAVCRHGEDIERIERGDLVDAGGGGMGFGSGVRFAGVESTYFANVMAPDAPARGERCRLRAQDRGNADDPDGTLFESEVLLPRVVVEPGETKRFRVLGYFGPKIQETLAAAGHGLPETIDLGFFSAIAKPLVDILSWIHAQVGNWGLAIILLTFLVKMVLFPLTYKSFQSMARIRTLKPEMDRINELYGEDREKKAAATMELYRKHKINPMGGCLPQLLQLPIWWALYTSLSTNVELYNMPFVGWYHDLSAPDPYYVLPLALGVLMFVQQKITPTTMDPTQAKMMLYMMPTMITLFMLFLPSGLCLYMLTNSALGIGQQKLIEKTLTKPPAAGAVKTDGADKAGNGAAAARADAVVEEDSSRPKPRPGKGGSRRKGRGRA